MISTSLKAVVVSTILFSSFSAIATQYQIIRANSNALLADTNDTAGETDAENLVTDSYPDQIIYYTSNVDNSGTTLEKFNKLAWLEKGGSRERRQTLEEFYFANTRAVSNTGKRHVACFTGNVDTIVDFLGDPNTNVEIDGVDQVLLTVSEDKKMVGIEYNVLHPKETVAIHRHFRMPHCVQGAKAPLLTVDIIKSAATSKKGSRRMFASLDKQNKKTSTRKPNADDPRPEEMNGVAGQAKAAAELGGVEQMNGYTQYDVVDANTKAAFEKTNNRSLPTFEVRADYAKFKPTVKSTPWIGKVKDIRVTGEAEKLSQIILDHFLDSLITDSKNVENNFIAKNSAPEKSQWCHMPWLNVGDAGREAIHGLTKERDLEPTAIYPETQNFSFTKTGGSNWGIGFYNDVACASLNAVFGSYTAGGKIEKPDPQFIQPTAIVKSGNEIRNKLFPDGSASVKVLFTTADLAALKNTFTWTANTSSPKQIKRSLRPMRMLQIDVAIKDSRIVGTDKDADHWLMTTYYFDDNTLNNYFFENSILKKDPRFANTKFAPFLKMRPIGIQYGFDPSTSRIFKGSKTNTTKNDFHGSNPNLLNGPADNPTASCLSCHGAAGTTTRMVPGVRDFAHYRTIRAKGTLDFSMQLAFAKRNYETRPQMTK